MNHAQDLFSLFLSVMLCLVLICAITWLIYSIGGLLV